MKKNTLILVDRRDDPWSNVTATVIWNSGGRDHVWINSSGRGEFSGSGTVKEVQVAGETIRVYQKVNGNSTVVVRSTKAH